MKSSILRSKSKNRHFNGSEGLFTIQHQDCQIWLILVILVILWVQHHYYALLGKGSIWYIWQKSHFWLKLAFYGKIVKSGIFKVQDQIIDFQVRSIILMDLLY